MLYKIQTIVLQTNSTNDDDECLEQNTNAHISSPWQCRNTEYDTTESAFNTGGPALKRCKISAPIQVFRLSGFLWVSFPPTADTEVSKLFPAFHSLFISVKELFFQTSYLKIKFVPFLPTVKRRATRPKFDKFRQTDLFYVKGPYLFL